MKTEVVTLDLRVLLSALQKLLSPFPLEWVHDDGRLTHTAPVEGCETCGFIVDEREAHLLRGTIIDKDEIKHRVNALPNAICRTVDESGRLRTTKERVMALLSDGRPRYTSEIVQLLQLSAGGVKDAANEVAVKLNPNKRRDEDYLWRLKTKADVS